MTKRKTRPSTTAAKVRERIVRRLAKLRPERPHAARVHERLAAMKPALPAAARARRKEHSRG